MSFAIFRIQKLKTFGSIGGSLSHNYRTRLTHNADADRSHLNENDFKTHDSCFAAIKNRLPEKRRKDAVLCIEHLITASPDWSGWGTEKEAAFFERARAWLREKYGEKNVVSTSIHRDETTPHLIAYVVPLDELTGRLNAKKFIGGSRHVLSQMQTDFAKSVESLGLKRGRENSLAKHQAIRKYYSDVDLAEKKAVVERRALEQKVEVVPPQRGFFEGEASYAERAQAALEEAFEAYTAQAEKKITLLRAEVLQLQAEKKRLFEKWNRLFAKTASFSRFFDAAPYEERARVEGELLQRALQLEEQARGQEAFRQAAKTRRAELLKAARSPSVEFLPDDFERIAELQRLQDRAFLEDRADDFLRVAEKKYGLLASAAGSPTRCEHVKQFLAYDEVTGQSRFCSELTEKVVKNLYRSPSSYESPSPRLSSYGYDEPSPKKDRGFEI